MSVCRPESKLDRPGKGSVKIGRSDAPHSAAAVKEELEGKSAVSVAHTQKPGREHRELSFDAAKMACVSTLIGVITERLEFETRVPNSMVTNSWVCAHKFCFMATTPCIMWP
jgi:hypothetical protein